MTKPRIQWAKRSAFAEAAETLGVRTDQIAALVGGPEDYGVLWSTDAAPDDAQYDQLTRDPDGLLVIEGEHKTLPGYFRDLLDKLGD